MGTIALVGGDEFCPNCVAMDREILRRAGKPPPRVLILPAAAGEEPGVAAANSIRHFQGLGIEAAALMVMTRADAENDALAARVKGADVIYLTGGDPAYLLETLRHSAVWATIERLYRRGGVVAGSSAGAMALGAQMRHGSREWVPELGLAPRVSVLPHHERCAEDEARDLRETLPSGLVLLGIAAATACSNAGDDAWQVAGDVRGDVRFHEGLRQGPPPSREKSTSSLSRALRTSSSSALLISSAMRRSSFGLLGYTPSMRSTCWPTSPTGIHFPHIIGPYPPRASPVWGGDAHEGERGYRATTAASYE